MNLIRELGHLEKVFYDRLQNDTMTIVYTIAISSDKKVEDIHMEKVLRIMGEIFPLLRMRVVDVAGVKWFQEVGTDVVDFKRVHSDWRNVVDELLNLGFHHSGLLWRVRLVELEEIGGNGLSVTYKYAVLCHWAHLLTDGITNMKFCARLAAVMDSVLNNRTVDWRPFQVMPSMESLLDKNFTWSEIQPIVANRMRTLKNNPTPTYTSWSKTFPHKAGPDFSRLAYFGKLDAQETRDLIVRCKKEGVKVNGALSAAFNLAIYEELRRGGMQEDNVSVCAFHNVNLRRFLEDGDDLCGFLTGGVTGRFQISSSTANRFWNHSKEVTEFVHAEIQKDEFLKSIPTVDTINIQQVHESHKDQSLFSFDYTLSNIGVVDKYFSENGNSSTLVEWVSRSVSTRYMNVAPLCVSSSTFRGHVYINVDYLSRSVERRRALHIATEAVATLKRAIYAS